MFGCIKSNYLNKENKSQLIINGEKIFNENLEPYTIYEFNKLSSSIFSLLSKNNRELTKKECTEILLQKLLNGCTYLKLKNDRTSKEGIYKTKLDVKSYFVFDDNPLILEKETEKKAINENRLKFCWKCGTPVFITQKGKYKCHKCGFYSYVIEQGEDLIVEDESQHWNKHIMKNQIMIDMNKFENTIESLSINMNDYFSEKKRIFSEHKITEIEFCLAIFNSVINAYLENQVYLQNLGNLFKTVAIFCWENGLYFYELLYNSHLCNLYELKRNNCKKVTIYSDPSCDSCNQLNGKVMKIDNAIEKMPIPNRKCTRINDYFDFESELNKYHRDGIVLGLCNSEYSDSEYEIIL